MVHDLGHVNFTVRKMMRALSNLDMECLKRSLGIIGIKSMRLLSYLDLYIPNTLIEYIYYL